MIHVYNQSLRRVHSRCVCLCFVVVLVFVRALPHYFMSVTARWPFNYVKVLTRMWTQLACTNSLVTHFLKSSSYLISEPMRVRLLVADINGPPVAKSRSCVPQSHAAAAPPGLPPHLVHNPAPSAPLRACAPNGLSFTLDPAAQVARWQLAWQCALSAPATLPCRCCALSSLARHPPPGISLTSSTFNVITAASAQPRRHT